jgi:tetratricopeptide (TPR) repeat protein
LQRLVQLAPDAPDVLRLQAAAARQAGDMERAIELAARAWATAPGTDSTLELAGYQFMSGNSAEALRIVEAWVAEHPGDVRARMALASQFTHAASIDQAIEQYQAVLALEPDNVGALNNLAWELRLKDPKAARAHARRAVTLDPGDPRVLDTLAMVEHLAGDHREAQRHIARAIRASPDSPALLYHQAMIEAALGDNSAAIKILQKLLAANAAEFAERREAELLLASLRQE